MPQRPPKLRRLTSDQWKLKPQSLACQPKVELTRVMLSCHTSSLHVPSTRLPQLCPVCPPKSSSSTVLPADVLVKLNRSVDSTC